mmetsp:Transcript_20665/g.48778  ORF Transcript_20665/g.48778 Transcript_20665/m.48778 type:complete len:604 (-) Transcript_20665:517-2328(-)
MVPSSSSSSWSSSSSSSSLSSSSSWSSRGGRGRERQKNVDDENRNQPQRGFRKSFYLFLVFVFVIFTLVIGNLILVFSAAARTTTTTTNSKQQQQQQRPKNKKPSVVIHVGPHKTGSSTVQRFLYENRDEILSNDGYVNGYIESGREGPKNLASLVVCHNTDAKQVATQGNLKDWCLDPDAAERDFDEILNDLHRHNSRVVGEEGEEGDGDDGDGSSRFRHLVLSCEEFDRLGFDIDWLSEKLTTSNNDRNNFEIRVVVYYRRFHDWIGSYYNELAKKRLTRHYLPMIYKETFRNLTFPTPSEWMEEHLEDYIHQHAVAVRERFASAFGEDAVTVLDFHDEDESLEESFFCRGMPEATWSCDLARSQRRLEKEKQEKQEEEEETTTTTAQQEVVVASSNANANARENLDVLRIRSAIAIRVDSVLEKHEEERIVRMWEDEEEKQRLLSTTKAPPKNSNSTTTLPPRLCLSREQSDSLLATSLEHEKKLSGLLRTSRRRTDSTTKTTTTSSSSVVEEDFREQFVGSFCTLDTDALFRRWENPKEEEEDVTDGPWFRKMLGKYDRRRRKTHEENQKRRKDGGGGGEETKNKKKNNNNNPNDDDRK